MEIIIGAVIVIVVFIIFINPRFLKQLGLKFKGRTEEIMRGDASTPQGAKDYYNTAIIEKEEHYKKIAQTYTELVGKLDAAEKDLHSLKSQQAKAINCINACLDENNEDEAMEWAKKKTDYDEQIEAKKELVEGLKQAVAQQKEVKTTAYNDLEALKKEKERTVLQLEVDTQMIAIQESIDTIPNSETDRMLEHVREGAKKVREKAAGAKAIYEENPSTVERHMDQRERERDARQVLDEIKSKRTKK